MDDEECLGLKCSSKGHRDHGFSAARGNDDHACAVFECGLDRGFLIRAKRCVAVKFGRTVFCADRVSFPLELDVMGLCDLAQQPPCTACDAYVTAIKAMIGFALAWGVVYGESTGHLLFPCGVGKGQALCEVVVDPSKGGVGWQFDLAVDIDRINKGFWFHRKSLRPVALGGVSAYARKAYTSVARMQAVY